MTDILRPAHVATPYGFWADASGVPGQHATIGASHSVVQYGPDGYVNLILVQPGSSSGATETRYNIPFNPWAYGAAQPAPPTEQPPSDGGEAPPPSEGSTFPECPPGYYFNLWSGRCEPNLAGGGGDLPPVPDQPPVPTDKVTQVISLLVQALELLRS